MVRVRYSFGSRHTGRIANIKKQREKYPDIMRKVIDISDIVLEVLDARYIEESRNLEIEEMIDSLGKKLIFVFNKSDLVDVKKLEKHLSKLGRSADPKLRSKRAMRPYVFVSATKGIGLGELKSRIKMEAKRIVSDRKAGGEKYVSSEGNQFESWKRVHVGVIGVPNSGKSSVINFVSRRSVAPTAARAGFTKGIQKIRMSENILILDSPGVIPESRYTSDRRGFAEDVKIGARSYSDVRDPERAVLFLIRAPPAVDEANLTEKEKKAIVDAEKNARAIEKFYKIEAEGDIEVLIENLGRKKGFLVKGGGVDEDRTARLILRDWQEGRIRVK